MKLTSLKAIKELIKTGAAKDVQSRSEIKESYTKILYSKGAAGNNGVVVQGDKTGKLYAVAGRSSALFEIL